MTDVIEVKNFVEPAVNSALDNRLGLTVHQLAKSLGIRFDHAKTKLTERGMIERIKAQGFQVATIAVTIHSGTYLEREIESYVLDVNAAKFFVAKYDNEIGDAYLAWLINLEDKVKETFERYTDEDTLIHILQNQKASKLADAQTKAKLALIEAKQNESTTTVLTLQDSRGVGTEPEAIKTLQNAIKQCAKRNGGYQQCGKVRNRLKFEFGISSKVTVESGLKMKDLNEAIKLLETVHVRNEAS